MNEAEAIALDDLYGFPFLQFKEIVKQMISIGLIEEVGKEDYQITDLGTKWLSMLIAIHGGV